MNRRAFVTGLGVVLAVPLAADAPPAGRMYRIGYLLDGGSPQSDLEEPLRELGYVEGKNLMVERRFAAFKYDRLPDLAAELVRLKPDVDRDGGQSEHGGSEAGHHDRTHRYELGPRPGRCGASHQPGAARREHPPA